MKKTVHVIGDVMLDEYLDGNVNRISPEGPVQIFNKSSNWYHLGGAANVAGNLKRLGHNVILYGVIGNDSAGKTVVNLIKDMGIQFEKKLSKKNTIIKTRVMVGSTHLLRVDHDAFYENSDFDYLCKSLFENAKFGDYVLISDYAKGTIWDCKNMISELKKIGVRSVVDPKSKNFDKYAGAFIITPNLKELNDVVGTSSSDAEIITACKSIIKKHDLESIVVTLSERGAIYVDSGKTIYSPALAKQVIDVTGAGDTFISVLVDQLIAGNLNYENILKICNKASAVSVSHQGTYAVTRSEIDFQSESDRVVFTNGCFDVLHLGHIRLLTEAKKLGGTLIVGLNSDQSISRLKGKGRPINPEIHRKQMLESLKMVDRVIVFDEDTPIQLIEEIVPDVLVKGGDYKETEVVGADFVINSGGSVKIIDFEVDESTSKIIKRIRNLNE